MSNIWQKMEGDNLVPEERKSFKINSIVKYPTRLSIDLGLAKVVKVRTKKYYFCTKF